MKEKFWLFVFVVLASLQISHAQKRETIDLLSHYHSIKNALVADDSKQAASSAALFLKSANATDYKLISEGNIRVLVKDAQKISELKNIEQQREVFSNLSANMTAIAKAVRLSDLIIYQQYCPMKKSYWLSNEPVIKNPYYGSSMLSCGEITDTLR